MTRFTEVLLLAAFTPLLSFANDLEALRPAVRHDAQRTDGTIRGLLEARQTYYSCRAGYYRCQTSNCCYAGWSCCSSGSCCYPGYYCDLASNGVIGCCRDGRRCSGSVGDPNTVYQTYTSYYTYTTARSVTTTYTSTSMSTSTSTSTTTTLMGGPTQSVGRTITEVSVLDVNIYWSVNWVQGTSDCSPSVTSKSTSTENSSFTYIYSGSQSFYYYLGVVSYNTMWEVFINGVSRQTYFSDTSTNCTYSEKYFAIPSTGKSATQNITVVVNGRDGIDPRTFTKFAGPWTFEFSKLLIEAPTASSTSTAFGGLGNVTQTPLTPTGFALNASGRAEPYQPLLVFAGILLALLYCA